MRSWWCQGGGAAVTALLAVVVVFRAPRDVIFWAALVFFLGHTALAVWRYLRDRRLRLTVSVVRVHESAVEPPAPIVFAPASINALMVDLRKTIHQK